MPLPCSHSGQRAWRVCAHIADDEAPGYYLRFTGVGVEYWLTCGACADADVPPLVPTCEACFVERAGYVLDALGVRGRPEVRSRPSGLRFEHRRVHVAGLHAPAVAAIGPLLGERVDGAWLAVLAGTLCRVDLDPPLLTPLLALPTDAGLDLTAPLRIDPSPDGRFAAVVNTRGRFGVVLDLVARRVCMRLDRGDYHEERCEFSAVFFLDGQNVRIVHATAWNRLDVSDPVDGALLTARGPTGYEAGGERPAHYLDYFHAGLTVSPDGRWLVDDGWVWHPVGVLRSFDLRRWLHEDPWESEDGPSVRRMHECAYHWDGPRCFADDRTLVRWGFGPDDEFVLDAAVLHDVATGARLRWFAGPPRGRFVIDHHLLVFAESGTTAWDLTTGERLLEVPGFAPVAFHPTTRLHLSWTDDGGLLTSRLVDAPS